MKSSDSARIRPAGVLAERGKATMALMVDRQNNYIDGANRKIKERPARVRTKAGPTPKGMKDNPLHSGSSLSSLRR